MRQIRPSIAIAVAILALLTAACGQPSHGASGSTAGTTGRVQPGGARPSVVNVAVPTELPSLDPQMSQSGATTQLTVNVFETLYAVNRNYDAVPMLAAGYPKISADQLTYTIPLRKGVTFQNGQEMTAGDVVASLDRWGKVSDTGKGMFRYVASVQKTGTYQVTIHLKHKFGQLVDTLAVPNQAAVIMPKSVVDKVGTSQIENPHEIIGTGPFKLADYVHGQYYLLQKFKRYSSLSQNEGGLAGKKTVDVNSVKVTFAGDPSVRFNGLVTGQFEFVNELPGDYLKNVVAKGFREDIVALSKSDWVALNLTKPPLNNVLLRQAIAHAINTKQAMLTAWGSNKLFGLDGGLFMPQQKTLYTTAGTKAASYDPTLAKKLVRESGYKGQPIVYLTAKNYAWNYNISVLVAQELRNIGLNVKTQVMDFSSYVQYRKNPKNWDMVNVAFGMDNLLIPSSFDMLTGNWPFAGWYAKGDAMARLIGQWRLATTTAQKHALVTKIQEQFYKDLPAIKFGNAYALNAASPKLKFNMSFYEPTYWDMSFSQ